MLDFDYCGRRARDERAIALASPCAKARAIHFELATLYDRRAQQPLRSLRILVVEDEYLIASEIEETLAGKGAEIVGPAGCVSIGVQKGPPIGVQKGPRLSSGVTGMAGVPFALVAA